MAGIDWNVVGTFMNDNPVASDFIDVIKPYLPALARQGPEIWNGFLQHVMDKDWSAIDKTLYASMTSEERLKLDQAKFDRYQLGKEILKDLVTQSLLRLVLAVMV